MYMFISLDPKLGGELEVLVEELKDSTKDKMRVERPYTELVLEEMENKPKGPEGKRVGNYKELFSGQRRKAKGKKVLLKADPGFGKTIFSKKIVYDWATGVFKTVSIAFCIFLKLVRPGEAIENIIIDQYPVLEGLGVDQQKLQHILESFGNKCLIILDGLDQHSMGINEDIRKVVEGRKLFRSNILVTARPHSTSAIEEHFSTTVRINGFAKQQAVMLGSNILPDKTKLETLLNLCSTSTDTYNPEILASLCVWLNRGDIDITNINGVGEIQIRIIYNIYRKFTIRSGIPFGINQFVDVLVKVGKLALDILLSGKSFLKRSKIIQNVGGDAFNYGLLIGHEEFRLLYNDQIYITFPNERTQEFLGALYFMEMLKGGETMENVLGSEPILMTNSSFRNFCLWFLHSSQIYFTFPNAAQIYEKILTCVKNKIQYQFQDYTSIYEALNITQVQDELTRCFVEDIFVQINGNTEISFELSRVPEEQTLPRTEGTSLCITAYF